MKQEPPVAAEKGSRMLSGARRAVALISLAAALVAGASATANPLPVGEAGFGVIIRAPDTFTARVPITVSGEVYAVFALPIIVEIAQPVPNVTVEIFEGETLLGSDVTGGGGAYSVDITFPEDLPPTHTLHAVVFRDNAVLETRSREVMTITANLFIELAVVPSPAQVQPGTTLALRACGLDNNGRWHDVTEHATWTSSDPGTVTVSNGEGDRGRLTGVAPGTSTISASLGRLTASAMVEVSDGVPSEQAPCPQPIP